MGYDGPFIPDLVVKFEKFSFLFFCPHRLDYRIEILLISGLGNNDLSRHCLAFLGRWCSSVSFLAIMAQLAIFWFSYSSFMILSYWGVKGRLSGITKTKFI